MSHTPTTPGKWNAIFANWNGMDQTFGFAIRANDRLAPICSTGVSQQENVTCGFELPADMAEQFYKPEELEANGLLIETAGTIKNQLDELGYDGQKCIEILPGILNALDYMAIGLWPENRKVDDLLEVSGINDGKDRAIKAAACIDLAREWIKSARGENEAS